MELYSVDFTTPGIIMIVVVSGIFFLILNRLLSNRIQKSSTRMLVSLVLAILLTILGLAVSVYLQTRR
jgi:uncharacterized BrkB/YihY/UPF0761 family membrane protein